ncbi:caspase family protein [Streptomyces sp. Caat 7-52]|uniref:caspase, EACC1-associated type n=1 Tax=Streptomyces sp. Caat 7-52 TaxID=2949637 RepID=UPI0020363636|nr:caspase family protein [Streptomyces sp. Caat 7-52]
MTDGPALDGARAVLIGTGTFAAESTLSPLPSVDATLDDLRHALHEVCGLPTERITRVPAGAASAEIVTAVEQAVYGATGPVLLHYAGHGLLGPGDELYLATCLSSSDRSVADAVPYRTLRDLLGEAAQGSLVVLDCCFSGRARVPRGDGAFGRPLASARPRGSFLLTSASQYELSFAPKGERYTLFSGRLLRLLTEGDPAGPLWLTADRLHAALEREFADDPRVRPARQSDGTLGGLVLARNRAYQAPHTTAPAEPPADVPCPYPGLAAFRAEDSAHFFGRDDLVQRLLEAVGSHPAAEDGTGGTTAGPDDDDDGGSAGPVVVVGASGAGKSSLLRAGLLAGLERRQAAGDDTAPWPALLVPAPGPHPMHLLAKGWARATGRETHDVRTQLEAGVFPPPMGGRPACRLLVVDQFEELFTHCHDAGERAAFVAALAGGGPGPRPRVVLGLRADHYGSCLAHPELERALKHGQVIVPPMRERDLRAAIEQPAAAAGLTLDRGLADRLLNDLSESGPGDDDTGALPFLAHALRETWLRRSGARLTLTGYQATGGIRRSVATTGEHLYRALDDDGRRTLRELLLRMVHLPPEGTGTSVVIRHPAPLTGLLDGLPPGAREIRDRLADARLITVGHDSAQIAHEALLRAWPRLREWIGQDAAALLLRQQLRTAADEWHTAGRDSAFLLRGSRLQAALQLRRSDGLGLPGERESAFLAASEEAAESARRGARRRVRLLQSAVVALVVLLVASVTSAVVAVRQADTAREQRTSAQRQRELATYRALLAEAQNLRDTDARSSLELGLAAHALRPSGESRRVIFETLHESPFRGRTLLPSRGRDAVLAPDGRTLALLGDKGAATLWDVAPGSARRSPLARLNCARSARETFSFGGPGGRILAARCADDDRVTLWDLEGLRTGTAPRRLAMLDAGAASLPGSLDALALSGDGRTLAATGWWDEKNAEAAARSGATLVLWDVSDPGRPRRLSVTKGVYEADSVAFAPGGRTLATASDFVRSRSGRLDVGDNYTVSGVRTWDVSNPRHPRRGGRVIGSNGLLRFSPDGKVLATVDGRAARLIDLSEPLDPVRLAEWPLYTDEVKGFAFSRDGTRLATAGADGTVGVWDVHDRRSPRQQDRLVGHKSVRTKIDSGVDVDALAFGPDGRTLVSVNTFAAEQTEVIHWKLGSAQKAHVVGKLPNDGSSSRLALTPDGRTLAVGGVTDVHLWDITDRTHPKALASLTGPHSIVDDIALSSDGTLLASVHVGGQVVLWNVADRTRPRIVGRMNSQASYAHELAFAPRAPLLAVRSESDGTENLTLWNVADPARPKRTAHVPQVGSLTDMSFSPDGRHLVIDMDQPLWNADLWDVSAGPKAFVRLDPRSVNPYSDRAATYSVYGATAFSPDGGTVAIAGAGVSSVSEPRRTLALFDVRDPRHPRPLGSVAPEDEKEVTFQRAAFDPDGSLVAAAGRDGAVWMWSVGNRREPHLATLLARNPEDVSDLLFGRDGHTLVTASGRNVFLWDLGDEPETAADTIGMACRVAGGDLLEWEWSVYAPDVPYRRSCPVRGRAHPGGTPGG